MSARLIRRIVIVFFTSGASAWVLYPPSEQAEEGHGDQITDGEQIIEECRVGKLGKGGVVGLLQKDHCQQCG